MKGGTSVVGHRKRTAKVLGAWPVVEHFSSMHKVVGSVPNTKNKRKIPNPGMGLKARNCSTWEVKAGGSGRRPRSVGRKHSFE